MTVPVELLLPCGWPGCSNDNRTGANKRFKQGRKAAVSIKIPVQIKQLLRNRKSDNAVKFATRVVTQQLCLPYQSITSTVNTTSETTTVCTVSK